jgi:hypothetical protein
MVFIIKLILLNWRKFGTLKKEKIENYSEVAAYI